ncbi:transposase [Streptomyces sp. NPDC017979]|uniref:transposase n=1 Tax=Streptomyces sp. NPDC017979 TaxID=3365024 RepID=UPI0037A8FA40
MDRFGAVLVAAMSVLSVEVVIGAIALVVWGQTQESPGLAYNTMGIFVLVVVAPFVAAAGAALGALLSVGVVMPLLVVAGWLGRRLSGREEWWWVPVLAAAGTALPAVVAAVFMESGLLACLGGGLVVTVALAVSVLVARRLLLPDRPWLSGGAMFGRVALYGTFAVVTTGMLAGIGLYAGIGYEPPRLSTERAAGTWSDGKGGVLTLTADGRATAIRVETFDVDESFEPVMHQCTGIGTWEYDPGAGPWSQEVVVSVDDCPTDTWEVLGTPEHPKLFVFVGDPDNRDLYILQRRDHAVSYGLPPRWESNFSPPSTNSACAAVPVPASSGRTDRHRLNRGGDRQANRARHTIVLVRMRYDPRTRDYVARRTLEGLKTKDIFRCLKRFVARGLPPPHQSNQRSTPAVSHGLTIYRSFRVAQGVRRWTAGRFPACAASWSMLSPVYAPSAVNTRAGRRAPCCS